MGANQSVAQLSEEAHTANKAGLYTEARRNFLEIVKLEPQRNAARVSAANMAMKAGNAELALGELNGLLARSDLSQSCRTVATKNQAAAAEAVGKARAHRLELLYHPALPRREEQAQRKGSELPNQAPQPAESIDHRLARECNAQIMLDSEHVEARPRRRFFLLAAVLVACLACATQTEMLAPPPSTRGLVGDTPSSTSAPSEPRARGGKLNHKGAKPMAIAVHEARRAFTSGTPQSCAILRLGEWGGSPS